MTGSRHNRENMLKLSYLGRFMVLYLKIGSYLVISTRLFVSFIRIGLTMVQSTDLTYISKRAGLTLTVSSINMRK